MGTDAAPLADATPVDAVTPTDATPLADAAPGDAATPTDALVDAAAMCPTEWEQDDCCAEQISEACCEASGFGSWNAAGACCETCVVGPLVPPSAPV